MRVWVMIRKKQRIEKQYIYKVEPTTIIDENNIHELMAEGCKKLDLAHPIILPKHIQQLNEYRKTSFYAFDYMEEIAFDAFDIELVEDETKKQDNNRR